MPHSAHGLPTEDAGPRGAGRPTSYDVAAAAGLSQTTVSRALRDDPRVSPATRTRVLRTAEELGYAPNAIGRSLVTASTRTVGMVLSEVDNPFHPHVVRPLQDELAELGYRLLLLGQPVAAANEDGDFDSVRRLREQAIDGVVLTTSTVTSRIPARLARLALSVVLLMRDVDGADADAVVLDNEAGGRLAAEALVEAGHRRIGAILGPPDTSNGRDRERGLRAGLQSAGVALDDDLVKRGPFMPEAGHVAALELLDRSDRPTALFCGNDSIAIGALNAACRLQLPVPAAVSVVGFDDVPAAGWEIVGLTTVHQPLGEMARAAARLLVARMTGAEADPPRRLVFAPSMRVRRTLGRPARA